MVKFALYFLMAFFWMHCDIDKSSKKKLVAIPVADPLPSWNDGEVKRSIIAYVNQVTDSTSPKFIPVKDRIATFDNDGTLWAERPYVQELFAYYRVGEMVTDNPSLRTQQPFKAAVEQDKAYFRKHGQKAIVDLINATHTGMSETEFDSSVRSFFATAVYPGRELPLNKIVYKPQVELLRYLRANGFKIFICTGGTVEFVRGISEQFYDVPKEQVIGTTFRYRFDPTERTIKRLPAIVMFNDKEAKPIGIQQHIGRIPVFACGNEGGAGDIAMLEFSQSSSYPSYQLLINHDDSTREFWYQESDNASMLAAKKNTWNVVSMKRDWKEIFPD